MVETTRFISSNASSLTANQIPIPVAGATLDFDGFNHLDTTFFYLEPVIAVATVIGCCNVVVDLMIVN